mgnify:CR=1 FL=1
MKKINITIIGALGRMGQILINRISKNKNLKLYSLTDIKVVRGIGGGCDEEALRVMKLSPKWSPGVQNGKKVRVSHTLPIFFSLK